MYKTTSKELNRIDRVASSSTKEHASGRIDMLPSWAREPEEYYQTIKSRWLSAMDQMAKLKAEVESINRQLKQTIPFKQAEFLKSRHAQIGPQLQAMEIACGQLRTAAREGAKGSFANVFYFCAKQLLDNGTFVKVLDQAHELLQRAETDGIGKPDREAGNEGHRKRRKHSRLVYEQLKNLDHRANTQVVYSTEKQASGHFIPVKDRLK